MSKLALCLPLKLDGGKFVSLPESAPEPLSIWKGNDPNPFDIVDESLAVERPRTLRFMDGGGSPDFFGGREAPTASFVLSSLGSATGAGTGEAGVGLLKPLVNACCAKGDRGGVRIGLSEIGDGGTNGKDSKIESALVDVELTTDDRSRPDSSSSNARRCCNSICPFTPADRLFDGEISFALVIRFTFIGVRGELNAALIGASMPSEGGRRLVIAN